MQHEHINTRNMCAVYRTYVVMLLRQGIKSHIL